MFEVDLPSWYSSIATANSFAVGPFPRRCIPDLSRIAATVVLWI
jgi:hypothetical protein